MSQSAISYRDMIPEERFILACSFRACSLQVVGTVVPGPGVRQHTIMENAQWIKTLYL